MLPSNWTHIFQTPYVYHACIVHAFSDHQNLTIISVLPRHYHQQVAFANAQYCLGFFPYLNAYIGLCISYGTYIHPGIVIIFNSPVLFCVKLKASYNIDQVNDLCFLYSSRTHYICICLPPVYQTRIRWSSINRTYYIIHSIT